jgi:hypothetical protein
MPEKAAMIHEILIQAETVITAKGDSPAIEISSAENRVFLLTLNLAEVVEQEYLELSVFGSPDGKTWAATPVATLPQNFYAGEYPTLLDLTADPETQFLRVHWEVARWGRGELTPRFVCGATLREVSQETLRDAKSFAR